MSKSLNSENKPLLEDSIYDIYINLKRKLISFIRQLINTFEMQRKTTSQNF
jgi:hypothetical protein